MATQTAGQGAGIVPPREDRHSPVGDELGGKLRRAAMLLIAAMWSVHFLMMTARLGVIDPDKLAFYSLSRLALSLCGAALCYGTFLVLRTVQHRPFPLQSSVAASVAGAAALVITLINIHAFRDISPASEIREYFALLLYAFMYWYWFYLSWSAAYLALSYSFTVTEQERRATALASEAHAAQMRALRYQVNPHFLFNALNSVAALIDENPGKAEEAVLKLSDLLRTSLTSDPLLDVSLEEEFALQSAYLEIERIRFPDRLRIEVDLPPDMRSVRLPCLLIQPLVENAIKHGVARSDAAVTIRLGARREGDVAVVEIGDDARKAQSVQFVGGMGIGLANVERRLQARYGSSASIERRAHPDGFTASLRIPISG